MLNFCIRGSTRLVFTTTLHALSGMTRSTSGDGILQVPAARAFSLRLALSAHGSPANVFPVIHQDCYQYTSPPHKSQAPEGTLSPLDSPTREGAALSGLSCQRVFDPLDSLSGMPSLCYLREGGTAQIRLRRDAEDAAFHLIRPHGHLPLKGKARRMPSQKASPQGEAVAARRLMRWKAT